MASSRNTAHSKRDDAGRKPAAVTRHQADHFLTINIVMKQETGGLASGFLIGIDEGCDTAGCLVRRWRHGLDST